MANAVFSELFADGVLRLREIQHTIVGGHSLVYTILIIAEVHLPLDMTTDIAVDLMISLYNTSNKQTDTTHML